MTPDESETDRHIRSLLASYGALETKQAAMAAVIEERTKAASERASRVDRELDGKAERTDLTPILQRLDRLDARLGGTNKLLVGLLVSITLAAVGFGFAALQFAGSHP